MGKVVMINMGVAARMCNSCAHNDKKEAMYLVSMCYGCVTQGLNNWKSGNEEVVHSKYEEDK